MEILGIRTIPGVCMSAGFFLQHSKVGSVQATKAIVVSSKVVKA